MFINKKDDLFPKDIDLDNDKLIDEKEVNIQIDKTNSVHIVKSYMINEGKFKGRKYHLFIFKDGMSIMNYNKYEYKLLSKHIDISNKWAIFLMIHDDPQNNIYPVALSYRY